MADDRTQVNVRISDEQHKRWKDFLEESDEYRHISELIRHSVEKEIEGEADDTATQPADSDRTDEVLEALDKLSARFDSVETTIQSAAEEMRSEGAIGDDTLTTVFEAVPEHATTAKTPEQIADDVDVSERKAAIALAQLRQDNLVKAMPRDSGDMEYYGDN